MLHTYKPSSRNTLCIKKPHQNPLCSFKDLSKRRDRQREATLFYTITSDSPRLRTGAMLIFKCLSTIF
jgi:hypothetical protein